jgi:membrane associated rhomboid family serine protease
MFFIPYGTDENQRRHIFPFVNITLVLINIAIFIIELYALNTAGEAGFEKLINQYAFIPASLRDSIFQISLLTAMFLHAGILHLLGNIIYLLPFGDNVEDRLGHLRYLLFYLLCGVAATLIFALFNQGSTVPLLGASGAIAGVLGGYIALHPWGSQVKGFFFIIILLLPVRLPAILFVGYWFFIQLFSSIASIADGPVAADTGGVAFLAHLGGFITGLLLAPLMAHTPRHFHQED